VLTCPSTARIWNDLLDTFCSHLHIPRVLQPPLRTEPSHLDALCAQLHVSGGRSILSLRGCWSVLDFPGPPPPDVLLAIRHATASPRPSRIVLALAPGVYDLRCNVSFSDACTAVFLFQNAAADALSPLAAVVPFLRRSWKVSWGEVPDFCPPPPPEAFTLHRRPPLAVHGYGLASWRMALRSRSMPHPW